ncbi:hypothetical protein YC2023_041055 [Brassica napus]
MDMAQGGVLVYQLDHTEVFMSDHSSPTARVIPSDLSVHADHNFPLDRADQTISTDPSGHPDRTARAVHRIDPRTSVLDFSLEPRPIDGFDRPTSLFSQPIQHSKTDSQARFNLGREESEDVHRFSLMTLLVHPACPEGCPYFLALVPDPLMDFSHPYLTKAWKLNCLKTCLTPHQKKSKEKSPRQTVSEFPFKYYSNNFDEVVSVQERLDTRCKDHIKTTRDVADPKRRLLQFDVQEICDNFEKGMMKALKDISKNHKKSTSTRAPVAEPSLLISEKPKGISETHVEEFKDFSDSLPIFDESDEEPIESLFYCEKICDHPSLESEFMNDNEQTIVELTVLQPEHPSSPIFDEEDEPGPVFDEEATSITSIVMESHLCFDPDTIPAPLSPDTIPAPLSPDLQEHYVEKDMHVLRMIDIVACLDTILVYNVYFDVHLGRLKYEQLERQVQSQRNESIGLVHQPEIWSFMNLRNGAVHCYSRDDPMSSQQLDDWFRKKHEAKLLKPKSHFDFVLDERCSKSTIKNQFQMETSRGQRHNTCVLGSWNWKYMRRTCSKLQGSKMDLRTNPFKEGEYDTSWIEHRPVWFMDTAQGGVLVYQLEQTETVHTDPSNHPDRTTRAVHRIDPRTTALSFLGVVSSKLNASFLLDRCVTSDNRSSFASLSDL